MKFRRIDSCAAAISLRQNRYPIRRLNYATAVFEIRPPTPTPSGQSHRAHSAYSHSRGYLLLPKCTGDGESMDYKLKMPNFFEI